ncbi:MAG: MBL fold metallo-hydrolase [Ignavibacteriales bacterium UTCHB2]|jgi:glyoxylase-like metal-dependent hydrolase (beta-lactamase superfamily II)|nr:MAG: putative quorum-quenching lactonase YtnP [Ignavibacteria bacterium ADurb.Bin266]OQY71982.1 MAG: MBL fold metallo-hydrolase [Ignavibacteriales bacterium UTCHB2]HQI41666.1 MBL fold metallo-hydrolase [Ignavibacteriaceae bacterium]
MQIGKYKLKTVISGKIGLDGGAMFGIIPKPLWEKTNPADEQNRVTLTTRNLLLISDDKKILIDTGMGNKWDDKSKNIYRIDPEISLEKSLQLNGLKPDDITDVILTHLHFDHTGGSTKIENDKIIPSFPNAKYFIQRKNFEWGMNPSDRDKGSYIKENFEPLAKEGVLNLIDGETDFDENISFKVINGHTIAQQMIMISDSSASLLYCCDLIPFVSQIRIPYIMGYDIQPLVTVEEKKKYLKLAADENWILYFGHDPDYALATVKHSKKGIVQDEVFEDFQ